MHSMPNEYIVLAFWSKTRFPCLIFKIQAQTANSKLLSSPILTRVPKNSDLYRSTTPKCIRERNSKEKKKIYKEIGLGRGIYLDVKKRRRSREGDGSSCLEMAGASRIS
eukprot:TRINITY_DN12661_c3_g1_i1.p1 TRINITY_DN12661_c3_g1~~TRINITY_DN12661_c3_g1_i1.p1  ORF type:complete len:109 (-),score=25.37 TRINITY_DN12661_c3_g1_i1:1761-2087(-)